MKRMNAIKILTLVAVCGLLYASCDTCDSVEASPCGGAGIVPAIDLIILIDASTSMNVAAESVSEATKIFDTDLDSCKADLRLVYFGVEGTFSNTVFDQNHRSYLNTIVPTGTVFAGDTGFVGFRPEQGANAISDLSNFMDWREGACRAILYISDEELDSISPRGDYDNENDVTQQAIIDARSNSVTVFSHYLTYHMLGSSILDNYEDLTAMTGGTNITTSNREIPSTFYEALLPSIVCNSCSACELNSFIK